MPYHLIGTITVTMLGAAFTAGEDAPNEEMKRLEGTWQLVSSIKDGKEAPPEITRKIRVVIKDGKHSVFIGDQAAVKEVPFAVDPTRNPKTTVDRLPDGKEIHGIYKLEGDTLTSCVAEVGKERPREFASKPGSGHTLRVFKRKAPVME